MNAEAVNAGRYAKFYWVLLHSLILCILATHESWLSRSLEDGDYVEFGSYIFVVLLDVAMYVSVTLSNPGTISKDAIDAMGPSRKSTAGSMVAPLLTPPSQYYSPTSKETIHDIIEKSDPGADAYANAYDGHNNTSVASVSSTQGAGVPATPHSHRESHASVHSTAVTPVSTERHNRASSFDGTVSTPVRSGFCSRCAVPQALRTKHCYDCDRCIPKFDHHCVWIGTCVAEGNHARFWWYLLCETVLIGFSIFVAVTALRSGEDSKEYFLRNIFILPTLAVLVLFFLLPFTLLIFHSYLAITNQTTWETLRRSSIYYMREVPRTVPFPFSEGCARNIYTFCCRPRPIDWRFTFIHKPKRQEQGYQPPTPSSMV
eukprot:GFYU01004871.1.p1 GENE.GFYU01004871.1~~GFYU01004871.1.p1  ORF type:complete len:373 (-),score=61.30 GFYU01004871.1:207-1325(-)